MRWSFSSVLSIFPREAVGEGTTGTTRSTNLGSCHIQIEPGYYRTKCGLQLLLIPRLLSSSHQLQQSHVSSQRLSDVAGHWQLPCRPRPRHGCLELQVALGQSRCKRYFESDIVRVLSARCQTAGQPPSRSFFYIVRKSPTNHDTEQASLSDEIKLPFATLRTVVRNSSQVRSFSTFLMRESGVQPIS